LSASAVTAAVTPQPPTVATSILHVCAPAAKLRLAKLVGDDAKATRDLVNGVLVDPAPKSRGVAVDPVEPVCDCCLATLESPEVQDFGFQVVVQSPVCHRKVDGGSVVSRAALNPPQSFDVEILKGGHVLGVKRRVKKLSTGKSWREAPREERKGKRRSFEMKVMAANQSNLAIHTGP